MVFKGKKSRATSSSASCQMSSIEKREQWFLLLLKRLAGVRCGEHGLEFIILFIIPPLGEEDGGDRWPAHERVAAARVIAGCCRAAKVQVVGYVADLKVDLRNEKVKMASATARLLAEAATAAEARRMKSAAKRRAEDILFEARVGKVEKRWVYHRHDVGSAREGTELLYVVRCERSERARGGCLLQCESYVPPTDKAQSTQMVASYFNPFKQTRMEVSDDTLELSLCECMSTGACAFHAAHGAGVSAIWKVAGRVKLRLKEDSL